MSAPEKPSGPPSFSAAARLRRVFREEQAESVVARAVEGGLCSQAQVDEARAALETGGASGTLSEALVARGVLDRETVGRLEDMLAREAFARPSSARAAAVPPEAQAAAGEPGRTLGDFVLVASIGRGGAGEVWKAWDRRLDRWVAIKISTASLESASARERFEREALAAARLSHPNIVPVFQVGAERERSFLVMPFIDGQTLEQLRAGTQETPAASATGLERGPSIMPPRQALELMRTVALAVEHAHKQGIVHRDIKPGNIMVDRAGAVFVLDFGLVYLREESSSRLTRPGDVLGTASYMAPEQARGDSGEVHGPAIDVYGLGATLYFLVTGRAPFRADSFAAVIARVLTAEPERPRRFNPALDARIETVVRKAMDKDPRRRYASAAALADDLLRVLEDREISARPAGLGERTLRALRRRPALAAVTGATLLILAVVGGARVRVQRERQAAVETLREMARLSLETALRLRRAGDLKGMRQVLPALVAAYGRVQERQAGGAEVEYLMGRMHRAMLDEARALQHQEAALALDPTYAPALYERAVLLSRRYGQEVDEAVARSVGESGSEGTSTSGPARGAWLVESAERVRPALARLRERILADCTALQSRPLGRANAEAARGILAFHRRTYDEARARLKKALASDPYMEEAWETLARAEDASGQLHGAEAAYTRALALDRGYVPHLVGRCDVRRRIERNGGDAIEDATAALALDPDNAGALVCRAHTRMHLGHNAMMAGQDPLPLLAEAEADLARALRPTVTASALLARGTVRRYRGIYRIRRGEDAVPDLDASEADFDRALAVGPARPEVYTGRGRTRARRGIHRLHAGEDPIADLDAAEADFTEAIRFDLRRADAWDWRGDARAHRALYRFRQGQPSEPDFAKAAEDLAQAITLYPSDGWAPCHRAAMAIWRGQARAAAGDDPLPDWRLAETDLDRAAKRLPEVADVWATRGELHAARANHLRRRAPSVARAQATQAASNFERALAIDSRHAPARLGLARLERDLGDHAGAEAHYRQVLLDNPALGALVSKELATLRRVSTQ